MPGGGGAYPRGTFGEGGVPPGGLPRGGGGGGGTPGVPSGGVLGGGVTGWLVDCDDQQHVGIACRRKLASRQKTGRYSYLTVVEGESVSRESVLREVDIAQEYLWERAPLPVGEIPPVGGQGIPGAYDMSIDIVES